MVPNVNQSTPTYALIEHGGYYISFDLPRGKRMLRYLKRKDVRTARSRPGQLIQVPRNVYRYMRRVAYVAILQHRDKMHLPPPPAPFVRRAVQLRLL